MLMSAESGSRFRRVCDAETQALVSSVMTAVESTSALVRGLCGTVDATLGSIRELHSKVGEVDHKLAAQGTRACVSARRLLAIRLEALSECWRRASSRHEAQAGAGAARQREAGGHHSAGGHDRGARSCSDREGSSQAREASCALPFARGAHDTLADGRSSVVQEAAAARGCTKSLGGLESKVTQQTQQITSLKSEIGSIHGALASFAQKIEAVRQLAHDGNGAVSSALEKMVRRDQAAAVVSKLRCSRRSIGWQAPRDRRGRGCCVPPAERASPSRCR